MALMDSLTDSFNDNSIAAKWTPNDGGAHIFERNYQIEITSTTATNYFILASTANYDLTGSYAQARLVSVGNQALVSYEVYPVTLVIDANNQLQFLVNQNVISAGAIIAGVQTGFVSTLTYSATLHKYFRIRESGGSIFWDYSADSRIWTNYNTATVAGTFAVTSLQAQILAGNYAAEASTTLARFDDFNIGIGAKLNNNGLRPHPFSPGIAR